MVTTGGGYSDADLERASNNEDDSSDSSDSGVPVNTPSDDTSLPGDTPEPDDSDTSSGGSSGGYSGGSSGSSTTNQPTSGYTGGSSGPSNDGSSPADDVTDQMDDEISGAGGDPDNVDNSAGAGSPGGIDAPNYTNEPSRGGADYGGNSSQTVTPTRGTGSGGTRDPTPAEENSSQTITPTSGAQNDRYGSERFTLREQAREAAEEQVETNVQEGLEGSTGRSVTVDGRRMNVQGQARSLEQDAIEQAEWADDESDVAVKLENGRLVAVPSRSAAVDITASRIGDDLVADFERQRRDREVTLEADEDGEVPKEELQSAEEEMETTSATFSLPDTVPFIGPGGQRTDIDVPFSDREFTLSGQTRDVELEQTESGDIEVVEQERFGDFDIRLPGASTAAAIGSVYGPAGTGVGAALGALGGGREVEDVTGAAGDRLMGAGEATGDVLARELVEERTVLPGAIIEERVTGDTSFTASATRGTAEGVASLGDQALNLPQETAEFAVEGASRTASGEGGEFAAAVGGAAVGAGIQTGRAAARNPGRFTGQLAGSSIAAGGGIAAATRFAGPRVGRAVSAAVQPGEELAISAARSGAVPQRAATLVPGVREGHIGEVRGGEASTGGSRLGDLNVRERVSSRTPNVRVESDPEAGVLEIDPELRQQVADTVTGTPRRVQEGAVAAGTAARGAAVGGAQRAVGAARGTAAQAGEAIEAVRDVDLQGAIRSGRRRARLGDSEFLADTQTGVTPGDVDTPSIDVPSMGDLTPTTPGVKGIRSRLPDNEFVADTGTGVTPSDISLPSVSVGASRPSVRSSLGRVGEGIDDFVIGAQRGPAAQGDITLQQAFVGDGDLPTPSLGVGGEGASIRAGVRSGAERVGEGVDDFIISAQRGPAVTGDAALQQAFLRGSDLPYPSIDQAVRSGRRRSRAAGDRLSGLSDSIGDVGVDVALRTPAHQGDITLQQAFVGDGDLPTPSAPSLDMPDVTGTVRREASAARFRVSETGRRFVGDVSDLTIRVGDPPRNTIFETDTEDTAPTFDAEEALGTELDADTGTGSGRSESDSSWDGDDPLDPTRTGVGIETEVGSPASGQMFRIRSETRPEANMETATDPTFETEDEFTGGRGLLETLQTAEPSVDTGQSTDLDVGQEPGVTTEPVEELDTGIETRLDTRQETGVETRLETRQDTRQEMRQELRSEVATEPASELRSELSADPLLRDNAGSRRRRSGGDDFAKEFEFGVASSEDVLSGESGLLDDS